MDSAARRHTQGPSGITKASKQGRRPGKTACTACHARKKRCDIAPPYHQCTHCRKEDQLCIPRDSIERPPQKQMPKRNHNNRKASKNENQFHVNGFLPKGIDHEVPRWSAVYSSYSEMRRLLPFITSTSPLTSTSPSPSPEMDGDIQHMQSAPIGRQQDVDVSLSGMDSPRYLQSETLYRDCAEAASIKGIMIPVSRSRSWSLSTAPPDERVGLEKALNCDAGILRGGLASVDEVRVPSGGDSHSAHDVFMNDLDALLRF